MSDDQFTKLFRYIKDFRVSVDSQLSKQDSKIDQIYKILDKDAKNIDDVIQENSVRDHQQKRIEGWVFQLADKSKIKLKY